MSVSELYKQGKTLEEVSRELGLPRNRVERELRAAGVPLRSRYESRMLRIDQRAGMSTDEMARLYNEGWSIRDLAGRTRLDIKSVLKRLTAAGVQMRTAGEGIRAAHARRVREGKARKNRRPSRPSTFKPRGKFKGEQVLAPPPLTSEELMELHDLSATERMLVYRMVGRLKQGKPVEDVLLEAGVKGARRQYHLMTTAIAAAREAGVEFGRDRRESA